MVPGMESFRELSIGNYKMLREGEGHHTLNDCQKGGLKKLLIPLDILNEMALIQLFHFSVGQSYSYKNLKDQI